MGAFQWKLLFSITPCMQPSSPLEDILAQLVAFKSISKDTQGRYLWAGSFSAWLVTFGIGFVNTTFHHEHGILACILLGLFVSYMTFNKKTISGE